MDHIQKHRDEQNARIAGSYNQPTPFEKAIAEVADSLEKAEGARGGRVIGHTKSGKPIYESHNHESHNNFNEQDHRDASVLQSKRAQEAYTEKYKKGIQEHLKNGKNHGEDYHDSLEAGAKRFGYDEEINKHAVAHMKAANKIQKQDDKSPNHYDPSEGEKQIRDRNVRKSEEDIELRKSELENEIGRLGTTIQSRINVDNGAPDSITKSMQIDLVKAKRQLAYIRQYGQIPS